MRDLVLWFAGVPIVVIVGFRSQWCKSHGIVRRAQSHGRCIMHFSATSVNRRRRREVGTVTGRRKIRGTQRSSFNST